MKTSPWIALVSLLALAFTVATSLSSRADIWSKRSKSNNFFGVIFGDGRKLFANQFFTMADVYFHSGYYPSIFDKNSAEQKEIISASHGAKETEEDEKKEEDSKSQEKPGPGSPSVNEKEPEAGGFLLEEGVGSLAMPALRRFKSRYGRGIRV